MVVVDPRRTETARAAHEHHFVRPGTDAFVLLAMLHVLFDEGLTTPPAYVDGLDAVRDGGPAVHPRARRGGERHRRGRRTTAGAGARGRGVGGGLRPGRGVRPRSSAWSPPGRCSCSTWSPATWTAPAA